MKKAKNVLAFLFVVVLCLGMTGTAVSAASSEQAGLEVALTADKEEYSQGERIVATLTLTNTNEVGVSNVFLENVIPEGYVLEENSEAARQIDSMGAGETVSLSAIYVADASVGGTDGIAGKGGTGVRTGDSTNTALWGTLLVLTVSGIIVTVAMKNKRGKRVFSLFLCLIIIGTVIPLQGLKAEAADAQSKISLEQQVSVGDDVLVLRASVSYDEVAVVNEEADTDQDGLTDVYEKLLDTDPLNSDTDGDGLSDDLEILIGTDPAMVDTDGDGVMDGDEDTDEDGLTNLEEIGLGTAPSEYDTDHDGLNDYDEINQYGTDPGNKDMDGDGANDGWEVFHGYDPKVADSLFDVTETAQSDTVSAQVEVQLAGEQIGTVSVDEVTGSSFFDDSVPGYIGSAFDFSVEGSFETATISFTFDNSLLSQENFVPVIYYFNEETQCLEALETSVDGNAASAVVTHFSTYILLNKTELDQVWENDIKPPGDADLTVSGIDVVFVIDSSGSMGSNDRNGIRKVAARQFVDKLGESDRGAVVDFDSYASVFQGFTTDRDLLYTAINRVNSSGGTNLSNGISTAISLFTSDDYTRTDAHKCIIFLTDGNGTYSTSYTTLAAENGIVIYTIGLGAGVKESTLSAIAEGTGGKYYFASSADELPDIYEDVSFETIDYTTDSNSDGISDYYTRLLCDGSLKLGTGKSNPFTGYSYEEIQADSDYDGDGLQNGRELVVRRDDKRGKTYVWMLSDPTSVDSDFDGIDDSEEEAGSSTNNYFTAEMKYSTDGRSYNAPVSFRVDYRSFFADNTQYNQELSVLASLYAMDMYNDGWLQMSSGTSGNSKAQNGVSLGTIFGLNDCVNYDADDLRTTYAARDSSGKLVDTDDVSEVFIGHRLISYRGEQREVIFLAVRGTNSTNAEWSSNFDIGADTSGYYQMTNEHPDWTNKENHKGFEVAASRIMKAYNQYINEMTAQGTFDTDAKRSIFITGHSRGGAIANILGAKFEDMPEYDSFVYTMAAPYTTTSSAYSQYKSIFNIMNEDDLVAYLPLSDWGFRKYGTTLVISVKDNYEDSNPFGNASGTFETLFGRDYNSNGFLNASTEAFARIADSREDFYILDTTSGDGVVTEGILHLTDSAYTGMDTLLTDGKMKKFCRMSKNNQLIGYTISITYSPAYAAQNIANLAGPVERYNVFDWLGVDLKGVYSTARRNFVLASGKIQYEGIGPGGMECPHMPGTYYLIAKNTSYSGYN